MECPLCDGQGLIYEEKVVQLDKILFICDECDACWTKKEDIGTDKVKTLTTFLKEHGITYEEAIIEKIGDLDKNFH